QRLLYRNLSPEQYEAALILLSQSFLQRLDRKERGGVQPFAFAVSVIYLADRSLARSLGRKPILTQRNLAKASGSAEFTIRDHVYRFLGKLYKSKEPELIRIADKHLKKLQNNSSQIN
ncbi:MAG: hypothetical protein IH840_02210, partial [Candidatus Heimdallarchaeota archaeon]|nr:hypothetical protein [Candidatus Heimdallarchaeota archaeon]